MTGRWVYVGLALSAAAHVGAFEAMSAIPRDVARRATAIAVLEAKAKPKPAAEEKPKPPEPEPPKKAAPVKRPAKPAAPPPPENPPPPPVHSSPPPTTGGGHEAMNAMPDFGLSLSGGAGAGTMALPAGGPGGAIAASARAERVEHKQLKAAAPRPKVVDDGPPCMDDPIKPKPIDEPQARYPDEAKSAEITGSVIVRMTVDPAGEVTDAQIVKGLGHGCDEAALSAARKWTFQPSTRCGRPVASTFTVRMRFNLSE